MAIEIFDMSIPLMDGDVARSDDIRDIHKLWSLITTEGINHAGYDPETTRLLMDGLDYLVLRPEDNREIIGVLSA